MADQERLTRGSIFPKYREYNQRKWDDNIYRWKQERKESYGSYCEDRVYNNHVGAEVKKMWEVEGKRDERREKDVSEANGSIPYDVWKPMWEKNKKEMCASSKTDQPKKSGKKESKG